LSDSSLNLVDQEANLLEQKLKILTNLFNNINNQKDYLSEDDIDKFFESINVNDTFIEEIDEVDKKLTFYNKKNTNCKSSEIKDLLVKIQNLLPLINEQYNENCEFAKMKQLEYMLEMKKINAGKKTNAGYNQYKDLNGLYFDKKE
jgi:hypothetical protein